MRRTYRSKKDTGGVLDRRDLLLNLDEKGSAYDAFFIQNIKETKRELSCIGTSNAFGVASNRVRKRKYVKRIVKEPESPCRESLSRSAYLTPDKSIRVNKPMDPFDVLLNSSNACTVETVEAKAESVTSKVDLFDKLAQKKEGKTYTRKKPVKVKKVNYSSCESDKENSDEQINATRNTSNIKAYQLLIENEAKTTPKRFNDSINNIVNNISLINKLKHKNSLNDSMKRSLSYYKNRLTRNIQSPILQKSPLCSTPFKVKYRGESIFKFSPISVAKNDDSLKYTTITEDKDDSNNSIILFSNENTHSRDKLKEKASVIPIEDAPSFKDKSVNLDSTPDKVFHEESLKEINEVSTVNATSSTEISSFQTTEVEPLLGFSNNAVEEGLLAIKSETKISICNDIISQDSVHIIDNRDGEVVDKSMYDENIDKTNDNSSSLVSNVTKLDNEECHNIDRSIHNETKDENNDNNSLLESNVTKIDNEGCHNIDKSINVENTNENNDNNSSLESNGDKDSLYDTCTSEQSSNDGNEILKEPIVQIEKMNDSSFMKYYVKMKKLNSDRDESSEDDSLNIEKSDGSDCSDSENDAADELSNSLRDTNNNNDSLEEEVLSQESEFASFENNTVANEVSENDSDNELDSDNNLESDSNDDNLESDANDDNYVISSNDDDGEFNNAEKCISFVTTRRRNEVTNNSMMSLFNDSYGSSSTDCDKTVLSNRKTIKNNSEIDNDVENNDTVSDNIEELAELKIDVAHVDLPAVSPSNNLERNDPRTSFVTTRTSNIIDRKSATKRKSSINPKRNSISTRKSSKSLKSIRHSPELSRSTCFEKPGIVLQPGKKWERSLSIYRRMTMTTDHFDESILEDEQETKGRKYRQSVISTMVLQESNGSLHNESINSRRSTFVSKPSRSTIRIVKDPDISRLSICSTTVFDDLKGFLNEECDDTIIELSKLSIADQTHEVTVLDNFHDTSSRLATARDYVLRRCNQADAILFDECYPDSVLKNCHKIGEGVYGEVFLWRDRDGRARVLKIVPIAGTLKVNGESQKDFHEIISEIVIAMELSALRAPIAEINRHFDEGKEAEALDLHAIENATDIFNEVLAVRCVYGSYPARLLDLWDLYDECKGSENDNPAILPADQQYIVLELANAGQDLESYQFNNAEQAYALFLQVAYGLAVAEEAFQFEHRDLHWGNVLIAPTEQKYTTFVVRGRSYRVLRCGVAATIIDYSLSRVSLPLAGGECAALYNDLATDDSLFDAVGDYQFSVYRLMRDKLGNDWKNFEPYTNILWLHYTVDKMITALRYKRTNTKIHKHYIEKLKGIKNRILDYGSAALFVLTDNEI